MLRITDYIRDTLAGKPKKPFDGSILIWNLTNDCNLTCKHCYSFANQFRGDELLTSEAMNLIPQLRASGVKVAILSGGEPLLRKDLYEIAIELRKNNIKTNLSTNGLMVNEDNIDKIKDHFDYVGISIDGKPEIHDTFRGLKGAYEKSLSSIKLCLSKDIHIGLRFTLTQETLKSLPFIFELCEKEGIKRIYISHLVYSGRGQKLTDLERKEYRSTVDFIIEKSFEYVETGKGIDVVTGNNEADAVVLVEELKKRSPEMAQGLYDRLLIWGGNQAGVRLVNINHKGEVRPDPFYTEPIENVKNKDFTEIWNSNGILSRLREHPRKLNGKCGKCPHIKICNGSSRARSKAIFGDYFQEDPACYID